MRLLVYLGAWNCQLVIVHPNGTFEFVSSDGKSRGQFDSPFFRRQQTGMPYLSASALDQIRYHVRDTSTLNVPSEEWEILPEHDPSPDSIERFYHFLKYCLIEGNTWAGEPITELILVASADRRSLYTENLPQIVASLDLEKFQFEPIDSLYKGMLEQRGADSWGLIEPRLNMTAVLLPRPNAVMPSEEHVEYVGYLNLLSAFGDKIKSLAEPNVSLAQATAISSKFVRRLGASDDKRGHFFVRSASSVSNLLLSRKELIATWSGELEQLCAYLDQHFHSSSESPYDDEPKGDKGVTDDLETEKQNGPSQWFLFTELGEFDPLIEVFESALPSEQGENSSIITALTLTDLARYIAMPDSIALYSVRRSVKFKRGFVLSTDSALSESQIEEALANAEKFSDPRFLNSRDSRGVFLEGTTDSTPARKADAAPSDGAPSSGGGREPFYACFLHEISIDRKRAGPSVKLALPFCEAKTKFIEGNGGITVIADLIFQNDGYVYLKARQDGYPVWYLLPTGVTWDDPKVSFLQRLDAARDLPIGGFPSRKQERASESQRETISLVPLGENKVSQFSPLSPHTDVLRYLVPPDTTVPGD